MAYKSWGNQPPKQDTGWGLIYRLNDLMAQIERDIRAGDLENWNLGIDRIYANITYKNPAEIVYDDNGKIMDIQFSKEDMEVFAKVNDKVKKIKDLIFQMTISDDEYKIQKINKLKRILYGIIFKKDIWIRKRMFKLGLYLQQTEHDPRRAIYGG